MLHDLAARYHACLQAVVQTAPTTEKCLKACARCGILFLAHPRNASRCDLRCPFGCREIHRKERSNQRSVAYYRRPGGRRKKRVINRKRARLCWLVKTLISYLQARRVSAILLCQ